MKYIDSFIFCFTEAFKYFILFYGIAGFLINKKRQSRLAAWISLVLLFSLDFISLPLISENTIFFEIILKILFVVFLFHERLKIKIRAFFLAFLIISSMDLWIWSVVLLLLDSSGKHGMVQTKSLTWLAEIVSCFVFGLFCFFLHKKKETIHEGFCEMSGLQYFLSVFLLTGLGGMAGISQGNVFGEVNEREKRMFLLLCVSACIIYVIIIIISAYYMQRKRELEQQTEFQKHYISLQKDYYESLIKADETMRRFRHDFNKHIHTMEALVNSKEWDCLTDYIHELNGEHTEQFKHISTGNIVADYFLRHTISHLKNNKGFTYDIEGCFPDDVNISDRDLTVLLGNTLENAENALSSISGKCHLKVVIKTYRRQVYIMISNTFSKTDNRFNKNRKPSKYHGYGISNMKDVVEKYNGRIEFEQNEEEYVVKIFI